MTTTTVTSRNGTGLLCFLLLGVFLAGCSLGGGAGTDNGEYVGRLEAVQMTSYMYGSHVLVTESGRYAVKRAKNSDVSLDAFEGTRVRVRARRVDGYPVDGGPPLLAVRTLERF